MLARAYAAWLTQREPTDDARARVIFGLLRATLEERELPMDLRLLDLVDDAAEWPLDPSPAVVLAEWDNGVSASDPPLDRRLRSAQVLGEALDLMYAVESAGRRSGEPTSRRASGSYFTPRSVARSLVDECLRTPLLARVKEGTPLWLCDPAMGGGAFLLEAVAGLARVRVSAGQTLDSALEEAGCTACGYDQNPLAVATAEAALFCLTGLRDWRARLHALDSLRDEGVGRLEGFDWVIGNPPWVAFQGRAAQKLAPDRRAWLRRTYAAFSGYPTLHGVFAERAAQLAPHGLVSLLLPSSLSDLDGYRAARAAVAQSHVPHEPLLEYGQDAFSGVVQPCFGLVASPRSDVPPPDAGRPWRLRERTRHHLGAAHQEVPAALQALASLPKLPPACFGELGLQSNRRVSSELFWRGADPPPAFSVPLLEGRNVRAFHVAPPRLFMKPDPAVLSETRCRLRPLSDYERVGFVVRQTAAMTIAAPHNGLRFRNSLLAGYAHDEFDVDLLVGLLNSQLLRAFHASRQRDARQAAFPQVKVAHLRSLPAPPATRAARDLVRASSRVLAASDAAPSSSEALELTRVLDSAVFDLYELSEQDRRDVARYYAARF